MSGFAANSMGHVDRALDGFVDKPLRPTTLAQLIRQLCYRVGQVGG